MSDLLVGCRASGLAYRDSAKIKGVIVDAGKYVKIMDSEGRVTSAYSSSLLIHPDDVRFIYAMNKNYKLRTKILENKIDRFEILDL